MFWSLWPSSGDFESLSSGCRFYSKGCFDRLLESCLIQDLVSVNTLLELNVPKRLFVYENVVVFVYINVPYECACAGLVWLS